jgi:hypothetical protein
MPTILWTDAESDYIVLQRRRRNVEFHNIPGRSRARFWESVARRFNRHFGRRGRRRYTGRQCEQKWRNLVSDYRVSNKINNNNEISLLILVFFRIFVNGVMVVEGEYGRELVKDTIVYLEPIFGKDQVNVKNDYLINFFTIIKNINTYY